MISSMPWKRLAAGSDSSSSKDEGCPIRESLPALEAMFARREEPEPKAPSVPHVAVKHENKDGEEANATKMMLNPEYDKSMTALIVQVHKCQAELTRKSREYEIVLIKSQQNEFTKDSKVETKLRAKVKEAEGEAVKLEGIEKDFALKVFVTYERQADVKAAIDKIYDLLKTSTKLKLCPRGRIQ